MLRWPSAVVLVAVSVAPTVPANPPAVAPPPREADAGLPPGVVGVLGTDRFRTPYEAYDPVVSPDGRRLAVRGDDGVRVLDLRTGRHLWRVRFPRKERLDGTTPRWTPAGDLAVLVVRADVAAIERFDPDGRPVGRVVFDLPGHHFWQLSGDGSRAAAMPREALDRVRVFDARTGAAVGTIRLPKAADEGYQYALSADGRRVAVPDGSTLRVYDSGTGAVVDAWEVPGVGSMWLTYSPDGRRVVASRSNADAPAVRVRDLDARRTTELATHFAYSVAITPDGERLAVGAGQDIQVLDLRTGQRLRAFGAPCHPPSPAFAPDGRTLVTTDVGSITTWDAETGDRLPESADLPPAVRELRFVGPGTVAGWGDRWATWDAATGRPGPAPANPDDRQTDLSPDGRFVLDAAGKGVRVADRLTGRAVWAAEPELRVDAGRFGADGRRVYLRSHVAVEVRDAATGRLEHTAQAPEGSYLFGVSPDGRYALTENGTIPGSGFRITAVDLRPGGGNAPRLLDQHCYGLPVAFTTDGRRVAYLASRYKADRGDSWPTAVDLVVREVGTWREVARMGCPFPAAAQTTPAVSPDGRFVATADDRGATLRELETGRVVRRFAHRERVTALAFSPDGATLAGAGVGAPVYLWDVAGRERAGPVAEPLPPDAAAVRAAVAALSTTDPPAATEALRVLHAAPAEAVAAIRTGVRPAAEPAPDPAAVRKWIEALDDPDFDARQAAEAELSRRATHVAAAARTALQANPSPERELRLNRVLVAADRPPTNDLAGVRAVGVLARIGTPEAIAVLREFAAGASGAEPTRSAADALKWLGR